MKILQISPINHDQVEDTPAAKSKKIISKEVLIVNSMLDPKTEIQNTLKNIIENFDEEIIVEFKFVSQVMKKNTIEWLSEKEHKNKTIFLIVGDCATCTYKGSQDIYELNEKEIDAFLVTFSEMKNLITQKLYKTYANRIFFIDKQFFKDRLQQLFDH